MPIGSRDVRKPLVSGSTPMLSTPKPSLCKAKTLTRVELRSPLVDSGIDSWNILSLAGYHTKFSKGYRNARG